MLLKIFIHVLGVVCIISTLLPLAKAEAWWIRIFDFPRTQILFLALVSIVLSFLLFEKNIGNIVFLGALFCTVIFQAIRIYPYTTVHGLQVLKANNTHPEREIGVYITNVYMDNRKSKACLDAIKKSNPDVVLALETDSWWEKQFSELEKDYPYSVKVPLPNTYGMLLYSRLKLIDPQVKYLVQPDVPSIHTLLELESGEKIMFYGVHPKPPAPGESDSSLPRDAELILVAKDSRTKKFPVIVAGDLNDVAWSHTTHLFQKVSGLLDPRIGRGMFPTFNAKYPLLRWPLDHLFHSNHFHIVHMERINHIHSDHFPICVKLYFMPQEKNEQEAPVASNEEEEEAEERCKRLWKSSQGIEL